MRIYRYNERHEYRPDPCPQCGGPSRVNWINADTSADLPNTWWVPGSLSCAACEDAGMIERGDLGQQHAVYVP